MARRRRRTRKYGPSTRKGMRRITGPKRRGIAYRKRRVARRKSNPAMFKGVTKYMKKHGWAIAGGVALGYIFRWTIADSPLGEPLDKVTALFNGAGAAVNGAVNGNGNGVGAIGMGAVYDPYGAVSIGAVHDPYGAVHINPHNLAAEMAARNTLHNYSYPPPGMA